MSALSDLQNAVTFLQQVVAQVVQALNAPKGTPDADIQAVTGALVNLTDSLQQALPKPQPSTVNPQAIPPAAAS